MLVDDAIVVVENISRHLEEREHTGKTIKQAIVESISEVELAVALSTLTRLLSFVAMFFVSGMMGDYM
jgi:multidrug efflux pump subunit AcrB